MNAVSHEDVPYLKRNGRVLMARIWNPPKNTNPRAILVDVHGGAWCNGDRTAGRHYDEMLASRGFIVAAIDFRQGPKHRHPDASDDVAAAIQWAQNLCQDKLGTSDQVIAMGSSSGGHLALHAALRPQTLSGEELCLHLRQKWVRQTRINRQPLGVAAFWAPVEPLARYRYALSLESRLGRRLVSNTLRYFRTEAAMHDASICRTVTETRPSRLLPIWIAKAGEDKNVPAEIIDQLASTYTKAGGNITISAYPNSVHGFAHSVGDDTDLFVEDLVSWLHQITEE